MGKLQKDFPPYNGTEPYIFLCFSALDEQRVRPLLSSLFMRGCRVWYNTRKAKNKSEYDAVSERIAGAALAVLFLTENACSDTSLKNDIKFSLRKDTKIIVLRADQIKSNLSIGLPEDLPVAHSEEELLRTEGFNADLIGPPPVKKNAALKIAAAAFLALALIIGVSAWKRTDREEIPEIAPEDVVELRLSILPESPEELEKYPNLEKLIVPQSMAKEAMERFSGYVIVLTEG